SHGSSSFLPGINGRANCIDGSVGGIFSRVRSSCSSRLGTIEHRCSCVGDCVHSVLASLCDNLHSALGSVGNCRCCSSYSVDHLASYFRCGIGNCRSSSSHTVGDSLHCTRHLLRGRTEESLRLVLLLLNGSVRVNDLLLDGFFYVINDSLWRLFESFGRRRRSCLGTIPAKLIHDGSTDGFSEISELIIGCFGSIGSRMGCTRCSFSYCLRSLLRILIDCLSHILGDINESRKESSIGCTCSCGLLFDLIYYGSLPIHTLSGSRKPNLLILSSSVTDIVSNLLHLLLSVVEEVREYLRSIDGLSSEKDFTEEEITENE
ncbi:hypothetical protein PMAYCL1PPCAC_09837, partial [Pristionchus mayeri]